MRESPEAGGGGGGMEAGIQSRMLFFKRLLLTVALIFAISVVVTAVLWAAGYFIHFTHVGAEPQIVVNVGAAPAGLIFILIVGLSAWLSTRMVRRPRAEQEAERRVA